MAEDKNGAKNTQNQNIKGQASSVAGSGSEDKNPVILASGQSKSTLSNPTKLKLSLALLVLVLILIVAGLLALSGGGGKKQINTLTDDSSEEARPTNNNSAGYLQSPNGDFKSEVSLNLNYSLPALMVSKTDQVGLNEQVAWQNGFTVMAVSVDRDYRPASEFNYKKIAESGDELVRVNFVVGNATDQVAAIGYNDLALYSLSDDGVKKLPERISEDVYSPKDGQTLGARQTQNISLHFRVKRDSHFNVVKSQSFEQRKARENKGEEKNPVLNLIIKLP